VNKKIKKIFFNYSQVKLLICLHIVLSLTIYSFARWLVWSTYMTSHRLLWAVLEVCTTCKSWQDSKVSQWAKRKMDKSFMETSSLNDSLHLAQAGLISKLNFDTNIWISHTRCVCHNSGLVSLVYIRLHGLLSYAT